MPCAALRSTSGATGKQSGFGGSDAPKWGPMALPFQPAILAPVPAAARFVTFGFRHASDPGRALVRLAAWQRDPNVVVGLGEPLLARAKGRIDGAARLPGGHLVVSTRPRKPCGRPLPMRIEARPSTREERSPACWATPCGWSKRSTLSCTAGARTSAVSWMGPKTPRMRLPWLRRLSTVAGLGLDGASFVAVQRWVHDLAAADAMSQATRESIVGRRQGSNEEIADAPLSAHVKRTAQESFEPPAFVLRRSMPYGGIAEHGLYFIAYGESLDRFERQLRRMAGRDDGIVDGLMAFTKAVTGGYYFCPPVLGDKLDLRALGL